MVTLITTGGKGTRLSSISNDIPKPMVKIGDKPILELQVDLFKRYHLNNFIFLNGHLSNIIEDYFGDGGRFNVNIINIKEPFPLGTAGCLLLAEEYITDDFIVINGDLVLDVDLKRFIDFYYHTHSDAVLFLHPNDHPYDSDLVEIDDDKNVITLHSKPHDTGRFYKNLVNAGLYIFSKRVLSLLGGNEKADMGRDLIQRILSSGMKIKGYVSPEYVKDMGTPDRYEKVTHDYVSGKVARLHYDKKRPAVFLDRDGVINREVNFLSDINDFQLLPKTTDAIKKLNSAGILAVVVTNQPVVARNMVSFDELNEIHNKMDWLLGLERCYVDALYFCPHHPDSGFPEERKELKFDCDCRKPKPEMLFRAMREYNIDAERSYMVGDRVSDIVAGKNAGVKTVLVKTNGEFWSADPDEADFSAESLDSAVENIVKDTM